MDLATTTLQMTIKSFVYVSIIVEHRYYRNCVHNEYLNPFWEIYSLRSNSWKELDVCVPSSYQTKRTQVYMDDVCHWLGNKDQRISPIEPCLVSFYLSNEVFLITPKPLNLDDCFDVFNIRGNWVNLAVLNGSIALISYHVETTTLHLLILGELGIKESWIKLFVVGPLPCIKYPIGVGMKGEIFFIRKDNELVWFDLRTQTFVELGYKAEDYFSRITLYKERFHPIE
ncbi:uncharacterized protein LOC123884381 [Trifolium pratense]|uniref:uncharacterized protein LOC123884381 n=1 Tax=Trifolium pratense TaxID=57577 RepID=UPI001E692363|nr:uncharacterized protein LOC123884381 [Trifolium pratense]